MVRRISTTVATLAVVMLIYAVFVGVILRRVSGMITVGGVNAPCTCATCQARRTPPGVPIFGVRAPVSSVVAASATALAMPLVAEWMTHLRRRRRERLDQCVECGYQLTRFRGRCPGCGVRVGPG